MTTLHFFMTEPIQRTTHLPSSSNSPLNNTQTSHLQNSAELINLTESNDVTTGDDDGNVDALNHLLGTATLMVSALTIFGNGSLMWIIIRTPKLRTITNGFIVSLAFSDLLVGLLVMPFCAGVLFEDDWVFSSGFCEVTGFLGNLCNIAALLNLTMVSIDRCVAVSLPFKYSYRMSPGVAGSMLSGVWITSLVFASMPSFGWGKYEHVVASMTCTLNWRQDVSYLVTRNVTCVLLPGMLIAVLFLLILKAAHAQRRVFAIMPLPVGLALATSLGPSASVNYRRNTLQAIRTLFTIVAVLALLWTPYTVLKMVDLKNDGQVSFTAMRICAWISMFSSAVNPVIFLNNKKYNTRFKALINCGSDRGSGGGDNRIFPQEGVAATPRTLSTMVPSVADFPSTSGFISPVASRRNSSSFIGANLNTLQIPTLKSTSLVPIIKFDPPIVTITPSTPVHEGKGKKSPRSPVKSMDAVTGLNVKEDMPTTPVHSMKNGRRDPLGNIEQIFDIKYL